MKANKLKFIEDPNIWKLSDLERRYLSEFDEEFIISKGEELDTSLNLKPKDFLIHEKDMTTMTTPQLNEAIERELERGIRKVNKYLIEKHRRTADPFTVIILTLIGVSVSSRKSRGGIGFHLALGVTMGASFVVLSRFCETFAQNVSFSPLLGVWIPNIIFTIIALLMLHKAQK